MAERPPEALFKRVDESPDELFYEQPRFVAHIDQETIDALTAYYREVIPAGSNVLDLMSSWISHLPSDVAYGRVSGHGMNREELEANEQLTDFWVQNLNETPEIEADGTYDAITCAVSIQYLTQPVAVMTSVYGKTNPGGMIHIAMSHRCFPTKAIAAFQHMGPRERVQLVGYYLEQAGFIDIEFRDRSPQSADPLWTVCGRRSAG